MKKQEEKKQDEKNEADLQVPPHILSVNQLTASYRVDNLQGYRLDGKVDDTPVNPEESHRYYQEQLDKVRRMNTYNPGARRKSTGDTKPKE